MIRFVFTAFVVVILAVGAACSHSAARSAVETKPPAAQPPPSPDPTVLCLSLAPTDAFQPSANPGAVLATCQEAMATQVEPSPQLVFAFARAAWAARSREEAVSAMKLAATRGICEANFYVGFEEWAVKHQAHEAVAWFEAGKSCGDRRAAAEIFDISSVPRSAHPEVLVALEARRTDELNGRRWANSQYALGLALAAGEQFAGSDFAVCYTAQLWPGDKVLRALRAAGGGDPVSIIDGILYQKGLPLVLRLLYPAFDKPVEELKDSLIAAGKADYFALTESYPCKSLPLYRLMQGIQEFAATPRTLMSQVQERWPHLKSIHELKEIFEGEKKP